VGNYSWILIVPILAVLVIVHEFGHFLTARYFGVKVEEFGVGLPPRIVGREWKGTLWSLNWIPLGGFARMKDENTAGEAPDSFQSKPAYARAIILLGGIIFNFIFAGILFAVSFAGFGAGREPSAAIIDTVAPNTPAQMAGWQPGDTITSIDGKAIQKYSDVGPVLNMNLDRTIPVVLQRNGQTLTTTVTPSRARFDAKQGATGIVLKQVVYEKEPVLQAIPDGFAEVGRATVAILGGLVSLFRGTIPGGIAGNVSGPIGIAQAVGEAVSSSPIPGWVTVARLTALISLNLAIFNLLPIPALDGGRLLFVVIEIIRRGRRVSPEREGMVHVIGMAVLLSIFVLVAFLDIQRIFDGRSVLPR